ncbi:MAG TPA: hypothetical protein VFS97_04520 [Nitrososphaeraceae archaeon]|nr:hypothetical protein [Nitrososphaeraceae archaeon]
MSLAYVSSVSSVSSSSAPANWAAACSEPPSPVNPTRSFPRSTSISLTAIPKQSNPACSTSLSSQSAIAAADSSSALFLFPSSS